jgi:FlaA1/EpsC-like NDP-sugar epimerase
MTRRVLGNMIPSIRRQFLSKRSFLLAVLHVIVFASSYWLAFSLRFDFVLPKNEEQLLMLTLPWVLGVKLGSFYLVGNYHGWLRYVTFSDLIAIIRASVLSLLIVAGVDHFMNGYGISRIALVLDMVLTILLLGGLRSIGRLAREVYWPFNLNLSGQNGRNGRHRALIVRSDDSAVGLYHRIQSAPELGYRVVGFLDTDPLLYGSKVCGLPVLGGVEDAARVAAVCGADEVLVIAASLPGKRLRNLMEGCSHAGLSVRVVPALDKVLNGNHNGNGHHRIQVRDVEINDLLRREPVELDCGAIATLLHDRTVMITGAGGSIGSEICRQVLRFNPRALLLVERAENSLFEIERELQPVAGHARILPCIADVMDGRRMSEVVGRFQPEVVFHAAAHKHVPMMEVNPGEAIKNNVIGTKRLADLAHRHGVQRFVLISTDKAVNPCSIMGASKQLAERYVYALAQQSTTKFVVVRFGNVLGSVGSVVPIFREQIQRGGPITVTHPDMKRYFMTIPEASQLVLQAAALGSGGEIFVLDMGEPVRIVDLAKDLIRLSGLSPEDVEITFTGPRPGEKLFEELYFEDERTSLTSHPKLRMAYHRAESLDDVCRAIAELRRVADASRQDLVRKLREIVPEYGLFHPSGSSDHEIQTTSAPRPGRNGNFRSNSASRQLQQSAIAEPVASIVEPQPNPI